MTNTRVVEEFLERVWNLGHVDECDDFVGDEYHIRHDPGDPWEGRVLSREEFKERVRVSRAPCPDQRFNILHSAEVGDDVFIAWSWVGSHLGDLAGFAPTGRELTMSGATVYFLSNGKISGHWQVVDRLGVAKQLTGQ